MAITRETMEFIKRKNVSKDAEKTRVRVGLDYRSADKGQKAEIIDLCDLTRAVIYGTMKTGRINAKLVLAMAQIFDVSPLYYIGETDEREALTETNLRSFLTRSGCVKPLGFAPMRNILFTLGERIRKTYPELPESAAVVISECEDSEALKEAASNLSESSAAIILQGILFQEKTDTNIAPVAAFVKRCLLIGMLLLPDDEEEEAQG